MITHVTMVRFINEALSQFQDEGEKGSPFYVYLNGFISGATMQAEKNSHSVETIRERIEVDFARLCRKAGK